MLRRNLTRLRHTLPTPAKHLDKPGFWGPTGGPAKDTLARRVYFGRLRLLAEIGKLTKPFRTKKSIWMWRRFQTRVWKTTVAVLALSVLIMLGNVWILMLCYMQDTRPSSPALERKVREHRLSKQIMQMVRERERDLANETEALEVAAAIPQKK